MKNVQMSRTVGVHSGEPNTTTTTYFPFKTGFSSIAGISELVGDLEYRTWSSISDRNDQITTTTLEPWRLLFTMSAMIGRHGNIEDFRKPVDRIKKKPFFSLKNDQERDRSL